MLRHWGLAVSASEVFCSQIKHTSFGAQTAQTCRQVIQLSFFSALVCRGYDPVQQGVLQGSGNTAQNTAASRHYLCTQNLSM